MSLSENLLKAPGNFNTAMVFAILKLAHYMTQFLLDRKLDGGIPGWSPQSRQEDKGNKNHIKHKEQKIQGPKGQEEIMNGGRLGQEIQDQNKENDAAGKQIGTQPEG